MSVDISIYNNTAYTQSSLSHNRQLHHDTLLILVVVNFPPTLLHAGRPTVHNKTEHNFICKPVNLIP